MGRPDTVVRPGTEDAMRSRFVWRAPESVAALVLLVAASIVMPGLVMGQGSEEPGLVTGTITTAEPLSPSSDAVAVVTIVDRSAGGGDVILGQQRQGRPGVHAHRLQGRL